MCISIKICQASPFYFTCKIALSHGFHVTAFSAYLLSNVSSLKLFQKSKVTLLSPLASSSKRWTKNVGSQLLSFPVWDLKLALHREGKERMRKETGYSTLGGGSFNKQGNLLSRLLFNSYRTNRYSHLPTRILKVNT